MVDRVQLWYAKTLKQKKNIGDTKVLAANIVEQATDEKPAAVALGRLGGLKGGKTRANKLTPEQRKEIASKAAKSRWQL